MRNAFASELTRLAIENQKIVLLAGDIGNRLFDQFKQECPQRFYNCGIAEANMTSIAAGMALSGFQPVTYTITPFNTARCYEQIRVDVCYQNVPVTIVGVGAGLSYASLGATHHSWDDIAIMRALPNISIVCPGDAVEVRAALKAALGQNGPVYIRIGKKNEPVVHKTPPVFQIGKGIIVRYGSDICLISTGNMLPTCMEAAELLQEKNISTQVVSFHTVKPLDEKLLADVFSRFAVVASIEEHSLVGGLGASIAEWLVDGRIHGGEFCRFGIKDQFLCGCGSHESTRQKVGLNPERIAKTIRKRLGG